MRVTALAVGLAIVMSSCGIQNQAGDSSSAGGKTKNYALSASGACWDNFDTWFGAQLADYNSVMSSAPDDAIENGQLDHWWVSSKSDPAWATAANASWNGFKPNGESWEQMKANMSNGIPCPAGSGSSDSSSVSGFSIIEKACYSQEYIDTTIAGFTEQINKPDATAEWKAEMQKGIDALLGTCVKTP
jgi:hypothetical protein